MVELTKLVSANVAKSLRATIPMSIVKQLDLKKGDYLAWNLDKDKKGWIITVRKGSP